MKKYFYYKSPIGTMYIYRSSSGLYVLQINEEIYGEFDSPIGAADNVYLFATGCYEWDCLELSGTVQPPTDIYNWKRNF